MRNPLGIWSRYRTFKGKASLMFRALRHRKTPRYARVVAMLTLVYLFSPIDFVPDYIPIAGWIDDLVIVPVIFGFALKLIPQEVVAEIMAKEANRKRTGWLQLALILLVGLGILWVIYRVLWPS